MPDLAQHPATKYARANFIVTFGVSSAAPTLQQWALPADIVLDSIEVMIPPGHAGLTGLAISLDGTQIVPWGGSFLVGDDITRPFDVGMPVNHPLVVAMFNTDDTFQHQFYLTAAYRDLATLDNAGGSFGGTIAQQVIA